MKKTKLMSRLLAIMLAFVMVFGLLSVPMSADYAQAPAYTNTYEPEYQEEEYPETEYSKEEYPEEEYPEADYPEVEYPDYEADEEPSSQATQPSYDAIVPANGDYITVFVSIEGYNLGHGFYLEPMAVTLPAGLTSAHATVEALNQANIRASAWATTWNEYTNRLEITGAPSGFYLASVHGVNRGFVTLPSYLANRTPWINNFQWNDAVEGGNLSEFDFTNTSGWMITVNNVLLPVGAGSWLANDGDVIRWQFTVYGLGADVGIGSGWGGAPPFVMQDRSDLIRALFAPNITASARAAALAVSINPLATIQQIAWATNLLLSGEEAPVNVPSSIEITPNTRQMFRGSSHTFTAVVQDQLGQNLPYEPVILGLAEGGDNPVAIHPGTTLVDGLVSIHPEQVSGTIILTATSGAITSYATITVGNPSGIARDWNVSLMVSKTVGQSSNFGISLLPANLGATLYGHRIEWASANDSVLTIAENIDNPLTASVTAVSIGSAAVTARLINEATDAPVGNPVNVTITVRPSTTGITITAAPNDGTRAAIQGATNINLNVTAYPAGANFTGYRVDRTIADIAVATLPNPLSPWNNANAIAVGAGVTTSTAQLVRISDDTPVGDPIVFTITVSPLTGLTIAPANANRTLVEGATLGTPVVLAPAGGGIIGSEIIRTSTNPAVITSAAGYGLTNNATAHSVGTARIYAQLRSDGVDIGAPVYFDFTVTPVLSMQILSNVELDSGDSLTLSVAQHGAGLNANRFIRWTSSNEAVVTVQEHPAPSNVATANDTLNNEITAVSAGTATITAQLMTGFAGNRVETGTPITFEVTVKGQPLTSPFIITAPTGANVQVFAQGNFHQITPLVRDGYHALGNGMSEFGFPLGGTHYRVSMDDKITRTGFVNAGRVTVTFENDEDPQTQIHDVAPAAFALRMEASTMVNINERNHLTMAANETFRLRGFRAAWEIINGDTTNMIVQPDFHVNVLYGSDVINIVPVPNQSNWFDITAMQSGTVIIEVYYDAIRNFNAGNDNLFAATNPVRRSVVVITVGGNTGSVNFGNWDTEFDTVYYLNTQDNGYFPVDALGVSSVDVAHVINGVMGTWQPVSIEEGFYNVSVSAGNNIVRVTNSAGRRDYQVVRAAQITPVFANTTSPGQPINPGDTFTLRFEGLFTPAPKMGNIYNPTLPGWGEVAGNRIEYTFNNTRVGAGAQYTFINAHTMTFTAPNVDGYFYFTNGNMPTAIFGFGTGFGIHRNITDEGTRFGGHAPTFRRDSSLLPDIPITIGTPVDGPVDTTALEALVALSKAIVSGNYTEVTINTLQQAIAAAETALAAPEPTVASIASAIEALENAKAALRVSPFTITVSPAVIHPGTVVTLTIDGVFNVPTGGINAFMRFNTNILGLPQVQSLSASANSELLRTITFTVPANTVSGSYALTAGRVTRTVIMQQPNAIIHHQQDFPIVRIAVAELPPVDKTELIAAIAEAQGLVQEDYTAATWAAMQTALADAVAVRDNQDVTQAMVDDTTTILRAAIDALVYDITWQAAMTRGLNRIVDVVPAPQFGSVGGEWAVLALARAGHPVPYGYFETYIYQIGERLINVGITTDPNSTQNADGLYPLNRVFNPATLRYEVRLGNQAQSTENSRLVVALTSLGVDASNFTHNGVTFDLIAQYGQRQSAASDQMWGELQGINGPIWNLVAINSRGWDSPYEISCRLWVGGTTVSNQITLDERIQWVLDVQLNNGGWVLDHYNSSNASTATLPSDPDMTAMALQALAPYRHMPAVAAAIDRALVELARAQLPNGGWASMGNDNVQSPAQVIVALTKLGIDPMTDARFTTPSGSNPVAAVLRFFDPVTGGFFHPHPTAGGTVNLMATEQATYSLVAYWRFVEGMNSLYDMSDAFAPPSVEVNITALNAVIESAQARVQANYTPATWAAMQAQLASAILVRDNTSATQAEVDAAVGRLNISINALAVRADKTALNNAISTSGARAQANYTVASWTPFQNALNAARQVRDNVNATQSEVNTAASNLNAARNALVRVGAGDPGDGPGDGPGTGQPARPRVSLIVYNPNARPGAPVLFLQGGTVRQMYIYIDYPNETAYSILRRPEVGLVIRSSGHHIWAGMYVEAINNFGEFDGGPLSGWMYAVNRVFPAFSASLYYLSDGDRLYWLYTYELGADLVAWGTGSTFGVNRGPIDAEIARARALNSSNYTTASWANLQTALAAAQAERDSGVATQESISAALAALTAAINALVSIQGGAGGGAGGGAPDVLPDDDLEDEYDEYEYHEYEVADPEAQIDKDMLADGEAVAEVIEALLRQAYEDGATGITISVPVAEGAAAIELELIVRTVRKTAAEGLSLTIRSDAAAITLDAATLAGIARGMNDEEIVRIVVEVTDTQILPASLQQKSIGSNTAIRLIIMVGDMVIGSFDGRITVSIPYVSGVPTENRDLLTVYQVDSLGNISEVPGARYENSNITFISNQFSVFFISEWISPFADVARGGWYFRNVRFAYSNGLMVGTEPGQFSPDTNLSRAMMVTLLWRMEGAPTVASNNDFSDVAARHWYSDAIAWASANGIVIGHGDGTFAPNDNITREQLALIFQNYMRFNGAGVFSGAFMGDFTDIASISTWAFDAMMWANANGLITGRTISTLVPDGTATRAEAAAIMQRFIEMQ